MLDKRSALALFERFRDQISTLQEKQRLGGDFYRWYLEVLDALEKTFGAESDEVREFHQIPFEIDQGVIRQLREQFALPPDISIQQEPYYHERLYDAEEFLLAIIVILRY